jgi:hypothetical protein
MASVRRHSAIPAKAGIQTYYMRKIRTASLRMTYLKSFLSYC